MIQKKYMSSGENICNKCICMRIGEGSKMAIENHHVIISGIIYTGVFNSPFV